MKIKRLMIVLTMVVLCMALTGCGKNNENQGNKESQQPKQTIEAATSFSGGSGTKTDPYQISNMAELQYLSDLFNIEKTSEDENKKYSKGLHSMEL